MTEGVIYFLCKIEYFICLWKHFILEKVNKTNCRKKTVAHTENKLTLKKLLHVNLNKELKYNVLL